MANTSTSKRPLIVCITDSEYSAVLEQFSFAESRNVGPLILEDGYFGAFPITLCRLAEMGSKGVDSLTQTLGPVIDSIRPTFVAKLGICFGLKDDFRIGDVGVCHTAVDYEYQKVNEDGIQHRARTVNSDSYLYAALNNFATKYKGSFAAAGAVYACGDKVVNSLELKKAIRSAVPDAKCGDMESYSFGLVCQNHQTPWILVKASSDDGINKGDEYQKIAARNSVKFFVDFLHSEVNLSKYFEVSNEVSFTGHTADYSHISAEIFGKAPTKAEQITLSRGSALIHHHPDMEGDWVAVYITSAHSVPEFLRGLVKHFKPAPARIDVCVVSRDEVSIHQRKNYNSILQRAGSRRVFSATIRDFVFDRVIKQRLGARAVNVGTDYVDQGIYKPGSAPVAGRTYARDFLGYNSSDKLGLKPISIILGQGGVGKTTFCSNVVTWVNSKVEFGQQMLLVTKSDVMKNYSGEPISSIIDLYREYARGADVTGRPIGEHGFELALSCGSIVMVIDGIDEIESACAEKFEMSAFIDSIARLNSSLQACRVILTSRDVGADRFQSISNADVVFLKGFDDNDVKQYISKERVEIQKKLKDIAPHIKGRSEFVNPYLMHVARQFLSSDDSSVNSQFIRTSRLDVEDSFDYILARIIQREIEKQSLGISIDDYYDLLSYVVVDHENSILMSEFDFYIREILARGNVTDDQSSAAPYLKCFLFKVSDDRVGVGHDEYVAQIMLNRSFAILSTEGELPATAAAQLEAIFGEERHDSFGIGARLVKKLDSANRNRESVTDKLKQCIDRLKRDVQAVASLHKQRAIYSLHLFAFIFVGARNSEERKAVIEKIHSPGRIDHLYVMGEFPTIDFSGCVIEHSEFRNYTNFFMNRFDEMTSFRSCRFVNCSSKYRRENVKASIFDETCYLDDGMQAVLFSAEQRKDETGWRAKSDIKQIAKVMRQGLGFAPSGMNRIKAQTNISSEKSYEAFVAVLCGLAIFEWDESGELLNVTKKAERDAMVLCDEDHVQGLILSAVKKLVHDQIN